MKKQVLLTLPFLVLSLTANAAPTKRHYQGRSKLDQSPCSVDVYREGGQVVAFAAKGHGSYHTEAFYLSPGRDSNEIEMGPDADGQMHPILMQPPFKASRSFFSQGVTYTSKAALTAESGIRVTSKFVLAFSGDEANPSQIFVSGIFTGIPEGSLKMTCMIK